MKTKKYKVRFENGKLRPLEKIDINGVKDGFIVFFYLDKKDLINELSGSIKKKKKESSIEITNSLRKKMSLNKDGTKKKPLQILKELH